MGGLSGLRKAVTATGAEDAAGGRKKKASDLAGARGLGVSLEQIKAVKLRKSNAVGAEESPPKKKESTPEVLKVRQKLKAAKLKAASPEAQDRSPLSPLAAADPNRGWGRSLVPWFKARAA